MTDKKNGREYLGYVLEKLKERITEISLSLVEGQKEIEGMHEYYWENYTEMDQYGYENYDNQQALFRQISANEEQLILKQRFRRMADSPFFGRVDFIYEGTKTPNRTLLSAARSSASLFRCCTGGWHFPFHP